MPYRKKCTDCGMTYAAGASHQMFCEAKTCEACGATYDYVLEVDADGIQLCEECQ